MTIIETMKAFLSGVSGYLLQFYAKEDGADRPNKVMSVASDGLILHNSDEEDIPFKGQNVYEIDPGYTDITDEQELFIDGSPSVVTSDGREPVTGYAGGTYIPATVNIEGVEYPNPSWYDGTSDAPVAKARGTYGFFEAWENVAWRETSDWTTSNVTLTKEGDWLKVEMTTSTGQVQSNTQLSDANYYLLLKKGIGDIIYLSGSTNSTVKGGSYTWSTDTLTSGTEITAVSRVKLSEDLVWLHFKDTTSLSTGTLFSPVSGNTFYFKDYIAIDSLEFIPPFGQDGNASSDNRAYNFDKWDQPISFTFKPQFDYDVSNNRYLISDVRGSSFFVSERNVYMDYGSANQFRLVIKSGISEEAFYFSKATGTWAAGTSTQTAYTSNTYLQEETEISLFLDFVNGTVNLYLDGTLFQFSKDLSNTEPNSLIHIGNKAPESDQCLSGMITNFCIHPKTQTLPVTDTFTDPNKQYGKNAKWFLDQFGNTPYGSVLASAGGIVEEGNNVNGSWVTYADGRTVIYMEHSLTTGTWTTISFPIDIGNRTPFPVGSVLSGGASDVSYRSFSSSGCDIRQAAGATMTTRTVMWVI